MTKDEFVKKVLFELETRKLQKKYKADMDFQAYVSERRERHAKKRFSKA